MISPGTKIRIAAVLAVSAVLFGWLGWRWINGGPLPVVASVVLAPRPGTVVLSGLLLGVLATAAGLVIGRPHGRYIAVLALPAGLAVWAWQSATMATLLARHATVEERAMLPSRLVWDVLCWAGVLVPAYLLAWLSGRAGSRAQRGKEGASDWLARPGMRAAAGVAITCAAAAVLLSLLARSEEVRGLYSNVGLLCVAPAKGQGTFAVAAAFFLGALAAHQLVRAPVAPLLAAPVVVALAVYGLSGGLAGSQVGERAAQLVPVGLRLATILPVQYVGVGTAGALAGYWYSVHLRHSRSGVSSG